MYVLEMNHVSKSFPGVKALDDVTLKVKPGTVHALMGENGAGKSTLMKCLFGLYSMDEGEIRFNGEPVAINNVKEALSLGISMIHQELHLIPYRSVMENIWLGRFPRIGGSKSPVVDHQTMFERTDQLLKDLNLSSITPTDLLRTLSVSKAQSVEIAKAVSYDSKIIIMDEPSSSLTENEVEHLFAIIRSLRQRGVAIIYISHKMEEILKISDEVTIMRDGHYVGTWEASELTTATIIKRMVGRDLTHRFPAGGSKIGKELLRVDNYTSPNPRSFKQVSLTLHEGEILGLGGLVGAQRTEVMEAVFGLRLHNEGSLYVRGKEVTINNSYDAKKYGMALLTEERRATGIFPVLSVQDNLVIANIRAYRDKSGLLSSAKMAADTKKSIKDLDIKTPSARTLIKSLSGGNQQKVLFARWLLTVPDILILDEPTRGIDVGAKYEIYVIMRELAAQGKGVIMISSEMPELLGMTDRVVVMSEGRVAGTVNSKETNQEQVMELATKYVG
ncbi:sugar ABC transporter ATP-binding protein [uncultured Sphaerochaeta sp.]|uniref:sugar ABC transporter ATP-binding protein n=1 Tax=uncultured Sphaerochaeta sp. TaxID=886478 RepID=UPI002AA8B0BB|nr:sugar ABC transporter ATP-binding protein [uncultured Sphaerochaeta sp.]